MSDIGQNKMSVLMYGVGKTVDNIDEAHFVLIAVRERAAVFVPVPIEGDVASVEVVIRASARAFSRLAFTVGRAEKRVDLIAGRVINAVVPGASAILDLLEKFGIKRALFHVRKHDAQTGETPPLAVVAVLLEKGLITGAGENFLNVVKVLSGEPKLLELVRALHAASRFTRSLNCGKKKPD